MKTERLSGLALINSHPNRMKIIKSEEILEKFLSSKPRRLFNGGKSCYFVFVFKKRLILKLNIFKICMKII